MHAKLAHFGVLLGSGYRQVAAGNHVAAFLTADSSLRSTLWIEVRSIIRDKDGGEESLV
jgi:hypothetical protein